jgi:hypothetical protein
LQTTNKKLKTKEKSSENMSTKSDQNFLLYTKQFQESVYQSDYLTAKWTSIQNFKNENYEEFNPPTLTCMSIRAHLRKETPQKILKQYQTEADK